MNNIVVQTSVAEQPERHVNKQDLKLFLITSFLTELYTQFGAEQLSIYLAAAALISLKVLAVTLAPLVKAANDTGYAVND
jgi:hypothetical protein